MYPIDTFPLWLTVLGAIAFIVIGWWVADKDNSARPIGLVALPTAIVSGWCWLASLPAWTAWLALTLTVTVFVIGMVSSEEKDDKWHYSALLIALFGKLTMWIMPWIWLAFTGEVTIPTWLLLALIASTIISIAAWRSEKVKNGLRWIGGRVRQNSADSTA